MRGRRLKHLETIIERQQSVPTKSDDNGLLFEGQRRRMRLLGASWKVGQGRALLPFGDRL